MIAATEETWVGVELTRRAAFEDAVIEHADALYTVAYSILRDAGDAEDAVQSVMEHAWRRWGTLREPGARGAWLRTICVRHCLRGRRRPVGGLGSDVADSAPQSSPDIDMERALRRLSAKQRAVVTLHYNHGYTLDECAALMGGSGGAVRSHLHRALVALRKELIDA